MTSGVPRVSFYREGGAPRMMNRQKNQSITEDRKVLRSNTKSAKIKGCLNNDSKNQLMTTETQHFIQKLCYRETASIDMTRHGFMNDSKINPVNYMIKPLRAQLEKICIIPRPVKPDVHHCKSVLSRAKLREAVTSLEQRPRSIPKSVKIAQVKHYNSPILPRSSPQEAFTTTEWKPCIPKSVLSKPGTRSPRVRYRVRIKSEPGPSPTNGQKNVKQVSPRLKQSKNANKQK